uniref:Methyltransferase-like protein 9 n=1 Tax=Lepeophtheirus salmonis TaxID=72036 RepID=C1BV88_LEPSM|nr:Methyltransferase-like protein 9 precursor [Lepeophtheirus salmonis]
MGNRFFVFLLLGWVMAFYGSRSFRLIVNKFHEDQELLRSDNKTPWYRVENPESSFVQLSYDSETEVFVKASVEKSDRFWFQVYHNLAIPCLKIFYPQTDVNGLLQRGSMFVLSLQQTIQLLPAQEYRSIIDLGAGDGEVTLRLKSLFTDMYATEASSIMRSLLTSKGFTVLDQDHWGDSGPFDAISCFNLLDRCAEPLSIIKTIKKSLSPNGVVILALVYPFHPYVEFGSSTMPNQKLNISTESFGAHVSSVVELFAQEGFALKAYSRVPYLCEGDLRRSIYSIDDSIFIFTHR